MYYLFLFLENNGYANAPQCYLYAYVASLDNDMIICSVVILRWPLFSIAEPKAWTLFSWYKVVTFEILLTASTVLWFIVFWDLTPCFPVDNTTEKILMYVPCVALCIIYYLDQQMHIILTVISVSLGLPFFFDMDIFKC